MTDKDIVEALVDYLGNIGIVINRDDKDGLWAAMQEHETYVTDLATDGVLGELKSVRRARGLGV